MRRRARHLLRSPPASRARRARLVSQRGPSRRLLVRAQLLAQGVQVPVARRHDPLAGGVDLSDDRIHTRGLRFLTRRRHVVTPLP